MKKLLCLAAAAAIFTFSAFRVNAEIYEEVVIDPFAPPDEELTVINEPEDPPEMIYYPAKPVETDRATGKPLGEGSEGEPVSETEDEEVEITADEPSSETAITPVETSSPETGHSAAVRTAGALCAVSAVLMLIFIKKK